MKKSGQASLEFLSTYGFAFIVLLTALGVISYLGIFNIADLQADSCSFPSGAVCHDFILNEANPVGLPSAVNGMVAGEAPYLRLILANTYGVNLTVVNMTLTLDDYQQTQPCGMFPGGSADWPVSENRTFWCSLPANSFLATERYDGSLVLNFTQDGGSYQHFVRGSVSVKAQ